MKFCKKTLSFLHEESKLLIRVSYPARRGRELLMCHFQYEKHINTLFQERAKCKCKLRGMLPYRDTRELPVTIWRVPIYYILNSLEKRVNRFW